MVWWCGGVVVWWGVGDGDGMEMEMEMESGGKPFVGCRNE